MTSGTTERPSTRDYVADYVRQRIFYGDYPAYGRVPQEEVAVAVGMSRIPVREALVTLEAEGYVSMPTNRGAFVLPYSAYDLRCQFELRGYTLGMAARRAASRDDAELVAALVRLQRDARKVSADPDAFLELMREFNVQIMRVGGTPRLIATSARMRNIVPGNFYAEVPGATAAALAGLRDEVRAQQQRDPEFALRAAVATSLAQAECLVRLLSQRGQLVPDDEVVHI